MNHDNTFASDIVRSQYNIFISEYRQAKKEGEFKAIESFLELKREFEGLSETDDSRKAFLLSQIVLLKKAVNELYADEFYQIIQKAKEYAANCKIDISNENDKIKNLFKYIFDFYGFQKTPDTAIFKNLLAVSIKISDLYKAECLISKFEFFFDKLNTICKIESFDWDWSNFETGLIKLQFVQALEKFASQKQHELEVKNLKHAERCKVDDLESDIKDLNQEIINLNGRIETIHNYYEKYYYKTATIISNTYFGDNIPLLFNLFNFLKRNNLLQYGWSHFYSCMIEGNIEIISLETPSKNVKPIGRIFYHLKDLLVKHYKTEPEKFIRAKFYINGAPLNPSFFINHVYPNPDRQIHPIIGEIDDFFKKQKNIFLRNTI